MSQKTSATTAVCHKIKAQFPKTPEGDLWYTILKQSIYQLASKKKKIREPAIKFFTQDIDDHIAYGLCDIDCDWIRRILKQAGLLL